jgi:hypothetical protein
MATTIHKYINALPLTNVARCASCRSPRGRSAGVQGGLRRGAHGAGLPCEEGMVGTRTVQRRGRTKRGVCYACWKGIIVFQGGDDGRGYRNMCKIPRGSILNYGD